MIPEFLIYFALSPKNHFLVGFLFTESSQLVFCFGGFVYETFRERYQAIKHTGENGHFTPVSLKTLCTMYKGILFTLIIHFTQHINLDMKIVILNKYTRLKFSIKYMIKLN